MPYAADSEIFELLADRLKAAAEKCESLAWHPRRGFVYIAFRRDLKEVEGACRQIGARREDARWFPIGLQIARVHKMCGNWLRNSPTKEARNAVHPLFQKTAEILRSLEYQAERLKTARTADLSCGRLGVILPKPLEGPHRDTRPVQVKIPGGSTSHEEWRTLNGLIVPPTRH